jgi:hypothetical protein
MPLKWRILMKDKPEDQNDQGTVTVEGMSKALDDLVKAADAIDLIKGNGSGIEHSGHVDERGKVGGGRASGSDAGGLDNMMIAKLTEAGVGADTIAEINALVGKQTAKKDDEEEEEEMTGEMKEVVAHMHAYMKENGSMDGYPGFGKSDDNAEGGEPMVKSMDQFRQDSEIADAIDVSPYLEAMTTNTANQIDNLRKSIVEGYAEQGEINRHMAAAMHQVGTLIKSQEHVISELGKRLNIVEREPNPQKGATTRTSAEALSKSMPGEAGGPPLQPENGQLSKSELLSTLTYMNLEKSIKNIGTLKTSEAIYLLEGGNKADATVIQAANDFLAQNPNEAQAARIYR